MNETGQSWRTAKELTEEIDRATSGVDLETEKARQRGVETTETIEATEWRGAAEGRGNKILAYGGEQQLENERVEEIAEIDNGYGAEARPGVSTVGEESAVQAAERRAWDAENIRNEANPKRDYEAQIMAKDQEGIARDVLGKAEAIAGQREFRPSELERLRMRASTSMLEAYENPYILGRRN